MDASSSAYHIMSYFLLNVELGFSTNLLRDLRSGYEIRDLNTDILHDAKPHIQKFLGEELYEILAPHLTRSLMKKIYMPLVYGKTQVSSITDIQQALDFSLSRGDAYKVAAGLYKYWENRFPAIHNLMTLVNEVGWFAVREVEGLNSKLSLRCIEGRFRVIEQQRNMITLPPRYIRNFSLQ